MFALVNTPDGEQPVELREVEEPEAAPDEAVIEVRSFSLNRGELLLLASRPEGWRPGQDIAGVVVEEARDGSGPSTGTRVVGMVDGAGWSERVAVPSTRMAVLPDEVSFAEAATLPIAGLTALRTLRFGGSLLGRRVLITGASGGVGRFAVEMAANSGASVTGVSSSPERGEGLRELGASAVVSEPREAEGPFDLILESVGGDSLAAALEKVAPGGTIVAFGNSSGETTPISFYDFASGLGSRIQSFFSFASGPPESFGEDLSLLASLITSGKLTPQVATEAGWRELPEVAAALRDRRINGKAILHVE